MRDELVKVLALFHEVEESGGNASLTLSTRGGKSNVKLAIEFCNTAPPTSSLPASASTTSQPASGRRRRHRGKQARARRNQRAAAHQASLAEAATSAPLDPPPSLPLRLLPSPPPESGRRRVMSCVGRLTAPTFSNLDGAPPPSPPPLLSQLDGVKPLVNSPSTPPPLSPTSSPQPQLCSSPLPPPCFPDPHPLCCHCTGTCPCSWGAPCRKCPKRTGRHHVCEWCPGSWCKWAPINHPMQIRSPRRNTIPRHLLEQPMIYSDKY